MVSITRATELVSKLSRTRKYPETEDGVQSLARGLQQASEATKIGAGRIIDRCAVTSEWCPTDAELLTIGRDLAREDAVAAGTFDSTQSAANSFREPHSPRCPICDSTGFEIIWTLHTRTPNGSWKYAKRENISADAARAIETSTIWPNDTQRIYSGARPCSHPGVAQ
jgi:hypothetical protein